MIRIIGDYNSGGTATPQRGRGVPNSGSADTPQFWRPKANIKGGLGGVALQWRDPLIYYLFWRDAQSLSRN